MKKIITILFLFIIAISNESFSQNWTVMESPNPSSVRNILRGVGFISSNDGWAVGVSGETQSKTLALHWNGINWSTVNSPSPGSEYNELYAVQGLASNDVYAVGNYAGIPATPQMLIIHWDGTSWSQISTPVITGGSSLECILAFGPDDIYAGGYQAIGAPGPLVGNLIVHWNGSSLNIESVPNQATNRTNMITDIKGVSTNDVWAVGYSRNFGENFQAMVLHKTGSTWNLVSVPQPGAENFLYSIDVIAPNDIWAVGEYNDGTQYFPLFLHYNGSTWTSVSSPGGGAGIVHNSANDIWSVGSSFVHYDGNTWNTVSAAIPFQGNMLGISRVTSSDMWAVGRYYDGDVPKTLIMHYGKSTGIGPTSNIVSKDFMLYQNYPNPFNPATTISFNIPSKTFVTVKIYDALGKELETLISKELTEGFYERNWNAENLPSGIYYYSVITNNFTDTKKMILLK